MLLGLSRGPGGPVSVKKKKKGKKYTHTHTYIYIYFTAPRLWSYVNRINPGPRVINVAQGGYAQLITRF